MKIKSVNHLGIAPKDPQKAREFFADRLGLEASGSENVADQKVSVDFFNCGESRLELLTPTEETSPIATFLEKKGSGIHHVALAVDNVTEWIEHLKAQGVEMIDSKPRSGAHNTLIAFVHPRSTGGVLVELVQEASA